LDGKVLLEEKHDVSIDALASKVHVEWPLAKLVQAGAADTSRVFVVADLSSGADPISRNLIYLAPTREVHLKAAHLNVQTAGANGHFTIRVTSPVLARDVYLSFGDLDAQVSENYFDVLPGETTEIQVTSAATLDALKAKLQVVSLTDAFGEVPRSAVVAAGH
jgi:beta-mannosidase